MSGTPQPERLPGTLPKWDQPALGTISRTPPPERLLFIAKAGAEAGPCSVGSAPHLHRECSRLASQREETLRWVWVLRQALDPIWGLRDFPVAGWSEAVHQKLLEIYGVFFISYKHFYETINRYKHPLIIIVSRLASLTNRAGEEPRPSATSEVFGDSDWIGLRPEYLSGGFSDEVFAPFEERATSNDLEWTGSELEDEVCFELFESLYAPFEIAPFGGTAKTTQNPP